MPFLWKSVCSVSTNKIHSKHTGWVASLNNFILGDDDEDDGGLFGKDEDDDREMEDSKGIMASDFFAPSTFEKRTKRVRAELDELEAEQIKEHDL